MARLAASGAGLINDEEREVAGLGLRGIPAQARGLPAGLLRRALGLPLLPGRLFGPALARMHEQRTKAMTRPLSAGSEILDSVDVEKW